MPDIKSVLGEEIRRLARKEVKFAVAPLIKQNAELKRVVGELKKRLAVLEHVIPAPVQEAKVAVSGVEAKRKVRLNAAGIVRIRTKLKLTQVEFAGVLGVSAHSVSIWEIGKVSPRREMREKICALRTIGKRELKRLLAEKSGVATAETPVAENN